MKQYKVYPIEQLLTAMQNGDANAFDELYYRYHSKVHSYAYKFVRCRDEAAELTQDVFVRLWEKRVQIIPERNFDAYLFTVVKNKFLTALRNQSRLATYHTEQQDSEPVSNSTESYINHKESHHLTNDAIRSLPPQAKKVFLLSREQGLSHDDISLQMGISKNTVSNHIKKSLLIIKRYFALNSPETILSLLIILSI